MDSCLRSVAHPLPEKVPKSYWVIHHYPTLMKAKASFLRAKINIKTHKLYTHTHTQKKKTRYNFMGFTAPLKPGTTGP